MTNATEDPALIEYVLKYSVIGGVKNYKESFESRLALIAQYFFVKKHYSLEYIHLYECVLKPINKEAIMSDEDDDPE